MREQISSKQLSREDFDAEKASLDVFSSIADKIEKQGFDALSEDEKQAWSNIKQATNEQLGLSTEISDSDMNFLLWRAGKADSKDLVDQAELKSREYEFLNQDNSEFKDTDMAKPKPTIRHITEESGIRFRTETPQQSTTRFRLGDSESFEARQKRAVENKGTVTPGLNNKSVEEVNVPNHPFKGMWSEARKAAVNAAALKYSEILIDEKGKEERVLRKLNYSNFGKEFKYTISKDSLQESTNGNQIQKTESQGVARGIHLAVLDKLEDVIGNSIEFEEQPYYPKNEKGEHDPTLMANPDVIVHKFVGVIENEGKRYRVITTMFEYSQTEKSIREYAYDVANVEVLNEESLSTSSGATRATKGLWSVTKLLNNFEKKYNPGKKILDESKNIDNNEETDPEDAPDGSPFGGGSPAPTDFASSVRFRIGTPSAA